MATYTFDTTLAEIDLSAFAFEGLLSMAVTSHTSTLLRFAASSGEVVSFYGSGISYAFSGGAVADVTGGTLSGFAIAYDGDTLMTVTGLGLSASVFADYVFAEDWQGLRAYSLRGNDNISGCNGNDTLVGGGGNDVIRGLASSDILDGGAGDDDLWGGAGRDTLRGGTGADDFIFATTLSATTNVDRLGDFNHAADTIRLNDANFGAIGALGALGAARFFTGAAAHDASDRVIYNKTTGQIFYDRDGTGAAAKVLFATVAAGTTIDHTDFLVF